MSPRAAWRLEAIAFDRVYDYVAGKADWLAAGLPSEGTATSEPRAAEAARRDVPTCRLDDDLDAARAAAGSWETCMVVHAEGVLLGRIGRRALTRARRGTAEEAMDPGPSTVRPNASLSSVVERMRRHDLRSYPVTTSDGRLVGLILRDEAERCLRRR
jgi:CBS-domain-containing membrane protein